MNKTAIRAFAVGMLLSTATIGTMYYYYKPLALNEKRINAALEEKGLVAVSTIEYKQLKELEKKMKEVAPTQQQRNQSSTQSVNQSTASSNQKTVHAYRLVISQGKVPSDISKELEEAKVIKNAASFTKYLESRGLTRKILIGTYNVNSDMSYAELSRIITTKK